jgi:large repetitive protein
VSVKDAQGSTVTQSFTIGVVADTEAPQVTLRATRNLLNVGEEITFEARAIDNVSVAGLKLVVNGETIVLDAQGRATKQFDTVQTIEAVATAIDGAGNTSSSTPLLVDVVDPTGAFDPVFEINGSLLPEGYITAPTSVFGSVGGIGFARYELAIAPLGSDSFTIIATGTSAIANGKLGTIDPTLLQNDAYKLRLLVYGTNGEVKTIEETVNIAGELKLGNFRLSFTDLAIPVTGIPISLTRTYDTLTANESDDFGYGWRMEFRDTNLRTSVRKRSDEEELLGQYPPFDDRTKVYITLPGGKREAYSFKPKMVQETADGSLGIFAKYFYDPVFESEKGSTNKLTLEYNGYVRRLENGKFTNPIGSSPFNPADPYYGAVYVLTTKDGTKYRIDAVTGDLLTVKDTNGNTLTYTDDAIVSSTGVQVTFERDAQGRIVSVSDPEGALVTYGYDNKGDLISVTDRTKNTTKLVYDTSYDDPKYVNSGTVIDPTREKRSHFLREIIDPLGRTGARTEYDDSGRLKQIVNVNGQAVDMGYDLANDRQVVKDQLGNETVYVYDDRGNILQEIDAVGKITKRKYDDDNNLLEEVLITPETGINGYKTTYTYDRQGNQLTRTNAMDETDIYTYNSQGKLLTSTDALGNTTKYTYDGRGNTTSKLDAVGNLTNYVYYENGLTKTIVEGANQVGVQDVTTFGYDRYGNQTYKKDAVGNETFSRYDRNGNELSETHKLTTSRGVETLTMTKTYDKSGKVKTVLDAGNGLTTYEYDANGNQTEVVNALGQKTLMVYDAKNQLLETILADNTPNTLTDNQRLKNEYDALGNKTAIVDQNGRRTAYNYDALKHPTGMVLPDGTPNDLTDNPKVDVIYNKLGWMTKLVKDGVTTEFEYDKVGRITKTWVTQNGQRQETSTVYDKAGRSIAITDVLGSTTKYVYDALDRVTETIYSDGKSDKTVYNYAGKELSKTDRANRTTQYQYDAIDRLTAVVDALNHKMAYAYDEAGNLIRQTDANQQVTQYEYDGLNRRTAVIRPMGEHSETVYDKLGRVTETKDFNGSVIQYGYDEKNELVSKKFVNEGNRLETYITATDARSRTVTDARGTTSYAYDERGRMLSKTEPDGKQISYTYDAVTGKVASVTTPSGTTQYRYNGLGQLAKVTAAEGETIYSYNAIGNLQTKTLANGIVETYGYDGLNRVKSIEQKNVSGTVIGKYSYSYDLVGNKTKVEELDGRSIAYSYDDLYRLTKEVITDSVHGNRTMEYVYDAVGNRLLKKDSAIGDTTYAYNANDRLLSENLNGITTAYTYDNNGNTKTKTAGSESTTYVWDTQNRLMGATIDKNGLVQHLGYEYNVEGLKTKAIVDGVETRYLLDENRQYAQVLEEYSNTGVQSRYVHGGELDLISQTRGGITSFYLDDGHSGVRKLTNSTGLVTDQYSYDAYGNIIYAIGSTQNVYQYRGEQSDPNLGMQYLRARSYNSRTGRFSNVDPFEGYQELPSSRHRYMYAENNPITYLDPSGETSLMELSIIQKMTTILVGLATGATIKQQFESSLYYFKGSKALDWDGKLVTYSSFNIDRFPGAGKGQLFGFNSDLFITNSKSNSGLEYQNSLVLAISAATGTDKSSRVTPGAATVGTFTAKTPNDLGLDLNLLSGGFITGGFGLNLNFGKFGLTKSIQPFLLGNAVGDASGDSLSLFAGFGRSAFIKAGLSIALPSELQKVAPTPTT